MQAAEAVRVRGLEVPAIFEELDQRTRVPVEGGVVQRRVAEGVDGVHVGAELQQRCHAACQPAAR